jgi:Flp pilus assembly pilin Flp
MDKNKLREQGQGIVEYALFVALLLATIFLSLQMLGISLRDAFTMVYCGISRSGACQSLFSDDFNNLNAWTIVRGIWKTENGKLLAGPGEGRIFRELSQKDYVISLNGAQLFQGNGYGIFFRATNPGAVNGYSFQYDPGYGGFIFRKWVNGNEISPPFAIARAPSFDWYSKARNVQVVVQGDTYIAYVDGVKVLEARDSTYLEGGMGLRTWDNSTISVDQVTVNSVK